MDDLFADCTLEQTALALAYAEPGSEDHQLALDALRARLPAPGPGIGHNEPPLAEALDEELEPWRRESVDLLDAAQAAAITDDDSAGRVLDLIQRMKAFEDALDAARMARTAPFRNAERMINAKFTAVVESVHLARGRTRSDGLRGILQAWDDRKRMAAREAAEKARREAAAREIAAASARKQLEDARRTGRDVAAAEIAARRTEAEATAAATQVERAGHAPPTRGNLGTVSRRRDIIRNVVDYLKCAAWLLQQPGLAERLKEAIDDIVYRYLRSIGVATVETGTVEIPGVEISVEEGDIIVRR